MKNKEFAKPLTREDTDRLYLKALTNMQDVLRQLDEFEDVPELKDALYTSRQQIERAVDLYQEIITGQYTREDYAEGLY